MSWNLHPSVVKEVAQSLAQAKVHARSLENMTEALIPLTDGFEKSRLEGLAATARNQVRALSELYSELAPRAFGDNPQVPEDRSHISQLRKP